MTATTTPAYTSFTATRSAVQALRACGVKDILDRSAWRAWPDAEQLEMVEAFRFLGFIDEEGKTKPSLSKLVAVAEDSDEEKASWAEVLQSKYPELFTMNLQRITTQQIAEVLSKQGATEATIDRAVKFFIKAAYFCDFELSSRLTGGLRSRPQWMRE